MTGAPAPISLRELNRAYLSRQMLLAREKVSALDAIGRLVAMQAQIPKPPFIGLWTRLKDFDRTDLLDLLRKRGAVRAPGLRGTLHLMTTPDYFLFRGTIHGGMVKGMQAILRDRADPLHPKELGKLATDFFATGADFDDLRKHLKAKDPKCDERAIAYGVRMHVPVIQLPDDSPWGFPSAARFDTAERWLKKKVALDKVLLEELVLRYLEAFGPASPLDAQTWAADPRLREAFEELRPKLVAFRDGKRELFDLPKAERPDPDTPAPVRFIPEYDNLVLGHQDRRRIVADEHKGKLLTKNLQVKATFLVDGFVAGTWKIERKKNDATLSLAPFVKIDRASKAALEEEGAHLLAFAEEGAKAAIKWQSIS